MEKKFNIILEQQKRTFKEWFSDFQQTSLIYGLVTFIIVLILFIPGIIIFLIYFFIQFIFNKLIGQTDKPIVFPDRKELEFDFKNFKIKAIEIYNDKYYDKLKMNLNKSDYDLREMEDICFLETKPNVEALNEKLFTYTMIDFDGGIILQEVELENMTSKLIFLDLSNFKIDIIKELKHTYELFFEKINEEELKITLKHPGEKLMMNLKSK